VDFLREFRKQIVYMHLRDQLSNGKWPESMGEGNVNFKEIGDVLREIHFEEMLLSNWLMKTVLFGPGLLKKVLK